MKVVMNAYADMNKSGFIPSLSSVLLYRQGRKKRRCKAEQRRTNRTWTSCTKSRMADPVTHNPLGAPKVICAGEALYDLFSSSVTAAMSEDREWRGTPGGATANVAAGLARLGTASALLGNVGDDALGKSLRECLRNENVNVDALRLLKGRKTREVFVRLDERGERSFVGFRGVNEEFADACEMDVESAAVLLYGAEVLVVPTLGLPFDACGESMRKVVEIGKQLMLRVFVDVNWRTVFWKGMATDTEARERILKFVKDVDVIKVSAQDLQFLFGESVAMQALEMPEEVLRLVGGKVCGVIVTDGEYGSAYCFNVNGEMVHGRLEAVKPKGGVVDTTGAGDAFLAGFICEMFQRGGFFALSDAYKVRRMMQFAATVASFVVSAEGPIDCFPTRQVVCEYASQLFDNWQQ